MKKTYTSPIAEKISFCYRDQVVAASGDPIAPQSEGDNTGNGYEWNMRDFLGDLIDLIRDLFG